MSVDPCPQPAVRTPTLLIVGSGNAENLRGLDWFLQRVWPGVRSRHPAAHLLVAGTICSVLPAPLPESASALGRLSNMSSAYRQAALAIAPVLSGSGVKIKVLEAIAHGRACVTTSAGIDGLEFLKPHIVVADSPSDFGNAINDLLSDLPRVAANGSEILAAAREKLSARACYGPIAAHLRALIR